MVPAAGTRAREGAFAMTTAIRQPAVAGRFYPGNAQRLRAEVETFTTERNENRGLGLRRTSRWLYVLGSGSRSRLSPAGPASAVRYPMPQSHREGRTFGHNEPRRMAHAAGRRSHRC